MKVPGVVGLYRHAITGRYYGIKKFAGKKRERSLETTDLKIAERRLASWIESLGKLDVEVEKTTLRQLHQKMIAVTRGKSDSSRRATLGIYAWVVEHRIPLKQRVLQGCYYRMAAFHANSQPKTLIEAVRARRIALKVDLQDFSKAIGRRMWSVSEWENGRAVPRESSRRKLIKWLGFDPEERIPPSST